MGVINQLGTQVKLPSGKVGTVVYNSLIGVGIKWGLYNPNPEDFMNTDGNTVSDGAPDGWGWEPDAILREPWDGCLRCGFSEDQCVGSEYEVIRDGMGG